MAFSPRFRINDPVQPRHIAIAALLVALGAWLRLRGAQGDLWLDEIWSLNLSATMTAWHEAFWKVIHDNNHPLNTMWLYFAGEDRAPWFYRLASIAAGTLSIVAVGFAMARGGATRMLTAMLLAAILYPLVHFGSEARGYGLMMLFSYIAFIATDAAHKHPRPNRWLFGAAAFLAAASHFASLPVLFMMCVAYAWREWREEHNLWEAFKQTLWFGAPSAAALAVLGAAFSYGMSDLTEGWYGGRAAFCPDEGCFVGAWENLISYSIGGFGGALPGLLAGVFAIVVIGVILGLFAAKNGRAYLYAALFLGTPLIYLALNQPNVPFGRYFIGLFAFVPLLLADALGEAKKRSTATRVVMALSLLALIVVNSIGLQKFNTYARGDYRAAVAYMENESTTMPIQVGTDMLFRLETVYEHYRAAPVTYTPPSQVSKERPEWLVSVLFTPETLPREFCLGGSENGTEPVLYRHVETFRKWGLSGTDWGLYRIEPNALEGPC